MIASPPRLRSVRELLVDDLERLLSVESMLAKVMLPKLVQEVQDQELKSALEDHLTETRQHLEHVKEAFAELEEQPSGKETPGLEGLKQEHDEGVGHVAPSLRDVFDAGAAIGAEHYEIAIYSGAVLLAEGAGEKKAASLLKANLDQEFAALKKLETLAERLAQPD
jgi:ferritin-like metal-binding protein YciE